MPKDPALLFYPSDFLTGTMFMSNEQVGIYIRLLCAQHQHGGIIDKPSFNSMVGLNEVIRVKFVETEEGFFNERLMIELEKRSKKSSNLSANAKIRWDKHKQKKCKRNAIALQKDMPTVNENEDIYYNIIKEWMDYKNQRGETYKGAVSKNAFRNKLIELSGNDIKKADLIIKQSMANNWAGIFELKQSNKKQSSNNSQPVN